VLDNGLALGNRATLAHIDNAFEDHRQTLGDLARLHDRRAWREMADLTETAQARNVALIHLREHLVTACFYRGGHFSHAAKGT